MHHGKIATDPFDTGTRSTWSPVVIPPYLATLESIERAAEAWAASAALNSNFFTIFILEILLSQCARACVRLRVCLHSVRFYMYSGIARADWSCAFSQSPAAVIIFTPKMKATGGGWNTIFWKAFHWCKRHITYIPTFRQSNIGIISTMKIILQNVKPWRCFVAQFCSWFFERHLLL